MTLFLSTLALIVGPLIYTLGRKNRVARQILDGFIFITIAGLVTINIIPEALSAGGDVALVFLALGIAFPVVLERIFHSAFHAAHGLVLILAALGLAIHSVLDGIALLPAEGKELAWAVILHRLPVGMAIWWSLRPNLGLPVAIGAFITIFVATGLSFIFGAPVVELASASSVAWLQAFISGSLIHVVAFGVSHDHGAHVEPVAQFQDWGYRMGILLGLFLVFTLPALYG
jgi:hypothetical protein